MAATLLIALGSNLRHPVHGPPPAVLRAARQALEQAGFQTLEVSRIWLNPPMGPRQPRFANALLLARADLPPLAVLDRLKAIERDFGRRKGRRWGPRALDLDLVDHGGTVLVSRRLILPHPGIALRPFVLRPLAEAAPHWRHPRTGRSAAQMLGRLRHRGRGMMASGIL
jgi:2-amino-4-hydroxy-6-hydroxymethyldihydropteridine diphosphokinase